MARREVNFPAVKESRIRQLLQIGSGETTQAAINQAARDYRASQAPPPPPQPSHPPAPPTTASHTRMSDGAVRMRKQREKAEKLRVENGGKPTVHRLAFELRPRPAGHPW
jgi:hypothetical protein